MKKILVLIFKKISLYGDLFYFKLVSQGEGGKKQIRSCPTGKNLIGSHINPKTYRYQFLGLHTVAIRMVGLISIKYIKVEGYPVSTRYTARCYR